MAIPRLNIDDVVQLVIDYQERLMPHIHAHEAITQRGVLMINACRQLDIPVLATEQYPKGLGGTIPAVAEALGGDTTIIEKLKFSACVEDVRQALSKLGRRTVLLCGVETHVCVMQTALDLAKEGYVVAVVGDAVSSQRMADHDLAMARMQQAGIMPVSAEMAILEMVHEAGTERFKSVRGLLK